MIERIGDLCYRGTGSIFLNRSIWIVQSSISNYLIERLARLQAASTKPKSGRRTYKKLIARGVSHLLPNERDNCDYCSFVSRNNNNLQLCNDLVNYSERILGSGTGTTRRNTKGRHFYKRNAFPLHFPLFSIILHIISRIVSSKFISTITISNSQPSSKIHNQPVTKILLLLCLWNIFATPFRSNLQGGEPNLPRIGPRNNRCVYSILPEQSSQR